MTYDRNLHHRRSIRLATYDYGSAGAYLVTVCTHRRDCLLDDDELHTLAEDAWLTVVNATGIIDEFVVMPNHVHGIIWIAGRHPVGAQQPLRSIQRQESGSGDISLNVGTVAAPLQRPAVAPAVVPSSLGAIVRAFKSSASRRINNLRGTPGQFVWQRNYYERIIRDEEDLSRVRQYIRDNPVKWAEDPEHPANLTIDSGVAVARATYRATI